MPQLAIRTRSGRVESLHSGYICVCDANNNIIYSTGNPNAGIFLRSSGKIGAEGIYCISVPEKELGICIKMFDGHPWSSYPVAVRILEELEILDAKTVKKLERWALPEIKDDKGNIVGYIHPVFNLTDRAEARYEPGDIYP